MSRYIDADALITDLNKGLWGKDWDKVLAEAIINEAPSIDIVRCKECMFADVDAEAEMARCSLVSFPLWHRGDYFCADGEREGE